MCGAKAQAQQSPMSSFGIGEHKKCSVGCGGCGQGIENTSRFYGRDLTTSGCVQGIVMSCACVSPGPPEFDNAVGAEKTLRPGPVNIN